MISISHPDGSLISKDKYITELEETFTGNDYILTTVVEDVMNWAFTVVDPFDRTYNPARSVKRDTPLENQYFNSMTATMRQLTEKGSLFEKVKFKSSIKSTEPKVTQIKEPR